MQLTWINLVTVKFLTLALSASWPKFTAADSKQMATFGKNNRNWKVVDGFYFLPEILQLKSPSFCIKTI